MSRGLSPFVFLLPIIFCHAASSIAAERDHEMVPEDYFSLASAYSCAVSPAGDHCAYVESRWIEGEERRQSDLWVVDLDARERLRLTFAGFAAGNPTWSADGRWIYFTGREPERAWQDPDGEDEYRQVWRVAVTGGEPFQVTRAAKGVGRYCLARDQRAVYYTVEEESVADAWRALREEFSELDYGHGVSQLDAVHRLDLVSWRAEEILAADRVIHDLALSPDERWLAMITTADEELIFKEGWSRIDVLDLLGGEVSHFADSTWRKSHPTPFGWLENLAWSGDSEALAFSIAYDGYETEIYVAEWDGGLASLERLERPRGVSFNGSLVWRGRERSLCFRGEERARERIWLVEEVEAGRQGRTLALTPGEVVVSSFGFSADAERLALAMSTPTRMRDLYSAGKPGEYERIVAINPQVDSWQLPELSIIDWVGADGDRVEGILKLPFGHAADDGPLPTVVTIHGGPTASSKLGQYFTLLPAQGYAVLSPNYHGSTGYGQDFLEKLIGRENEIEVTDIRLGIETLIQRGIADPERIAVMGWSNGGFLTNAMISQHPELFRAAISGAGVLDMVIQWGIEDTPGHVINYMESLPWEDPEAYRQASPLYQLDQVKTPTLIHVGANDPRVPPAHSRALYRALHHYLDVPVELIVYPGAYHGLSKRTHRLARMKWDLAWLERYLVGDGEAEGGP